MFEILIKQDTRLSLIIKDELKSMCFIKKNNIPVIIFRDSTRCFAQLIMSMQCPFIGKNILINCW